jgi:NAD(P)-dependent dehydrogenase (short-subunit alcohol dehydrogenase family)
MPSNLFDLSGKTALVTGGTKGIGRAIVERMIDHGARVALTSRRAEDAAAVADTLNQAAGREVAMGLAYDVNRLEAVQPLIDELVKAWGGLDVLVCNAAELSYWGPTSAEVPPDKFMRLLESNIHNNFRLGHAAAAAMKSRGGGSIIFITSGSGYQTDPQLLAYSVSKAGETHMARCLARELAPSNIRVNCVAPGFTRSESSRVIWENPPALKAMEGKIPLGRMGEADEVAAGVIFLASPGGAWTTGSALLIDGGSAELRGAPLPAV